MVVGNHSHGQIPKGIAFVRAGNKHLCRACLDAIAAAVAFIRIYGDEKFTGTVFVTVICQHTSVNMFISLEVDKNLFSYALINSINVSPYIFLLALLHQGFGKESPTDCAGQLWVIL